MAGSTPLPPGYPVGAYPPTGARPWLLGLLFVIPCLGVVIGPIAMAASYRGQVGLGERAEHNARAAANWGLTFLLLFVLLVGAHFGLLFSLTQDGPVKGFYPLGIPITIALLLAVVHFIVLIAGLVTANRGKAVRLPFAFPFVRAK